MRWEAVVVVKRSWFKEILLIVLVKNRNYINWWEFKVGFVTKNLFFVALRCAFFRCIVSLARYSRSQLKCNDSSDFIEKKNRSTLKCSSNLNNALNCILSVDWNRTIWSTALQVKNHSLVVEVSSNFVSAVSSFLASLQCVVIFMFSISQFLKRIYKNDEILTNISIIS